MTRSCLTQGGLILLRKLKSNNCSALSAICNKLEALVTVCDQALPPKSFFGKIYVYWPKRVFFKSTLGLIRNCGPSASCKKLEAYVARCDQMLPPTYIILQNIM